MSDEKEEKPFSIEKAKTGRATCKKCKQKCDSGELRIAKHVPNYFSDSGSMKHWYHIDCLFDAFKTQKATSKKIESVDDIDGWNKLTEEEHDEILDKLYRGQAPPAKVTKNFESSNVKTDKSTEKDSIIAYSQNSDDNLFQTFCNVCKKIASESGYNMKSEILQRFFIKGTNGKKFEGDIFLWFKLLLPMTIRRIYNLQSKQLVKLFARVFRTDQQDMLTDLEQGDVSETIRKYFEKAKNCKPKYENNLTIQEVDKFLDQLSELTKEDDQIEVFMEFCKKCNPDNLKMVIRLIKHDLKINAGPRHILDALNSQAYSVFQTSRDLKMVITKFAPTITLIEKSLVDTKERKSGSSGTTGVQLMFPISPMLAEACKSVEKAIVKNPEGMFSEIKYDGERVQIHKSGTEFRFFTRNLKPVLDHKIARCKEFIPKAFPSGQDMILDSEIVVVNTETGELLPFGTLGVHKREQFVNSEVCLFVFDCVYYNGEDLTKKTLKERKQILEDNIKPIKNHVQLSEYYLIKTKKELATMTAKVLKAGLEGLVLKNVKSFYQPGKRGWLKIKKDYLFEGQMADTADLVVLGGWFGTGRKGGKLSIFLMGSYDEDKQLWKTVTKVHSGLDDTQMDNLQDQLNPLLERSNPDRLPKWISCKRQLIPDLIAIDPIQMPVWEITGAEFTKSEAHTANGISIRFPRITRIREDKSPKEATNVEELELLAASSKDNINVDMLFKDLKDDNSKKVSIQTKLFDGIIKNEEHLNAIDDKGRCKDLVKSEKRKSNEINDCINNKKIKKESENSTLIVGETSSDGIFTNLIVYIQPNAVDKIENLLKIFINYGGTITENSKLANYVIHLEDINTENNEDIRKNYNCDCRHVSYKWLEDCIINKKIINQLQEYAVRL